MKFTKAQIAEIIIDFVKKGYSDKEVSISDSVVSLGIDSLGFVDLFMTLDEALNLEKLEKFTSKDYTILFTRVNLEKWTIEKLAEHIESLVN